MKSQLTHDQVDPGYFVMTDARNLLKSMKLLSDKFSTQLEPAYAETKQHLEAVLDTLLDDAIQALAGSDFEEFA